MQLLHYLSMQVVDHVTTLMPEDAEEGQYDLKVASSDCGDVTLHLLIGEPQGIHSVTANGALCVAPNPVMAGATFTINGASEAGTLTIYSATGVQYGVYKLDKLPVELNAPAVSGVYFVRYNTAYGVYESKLIVQ